MYFIKHSKLRNQSPCEEVIPNQHVIEVIYGCYASIVVENKMGSCMLCAHKAISSSNVVRVPSFCSVLKLLPY